MVKKNHQTFLHKSQIWLGDHSTIFCFLISKLFPFQNIFKYFLTFSYFLESVCICRFCENNCFLFICIPQTHLCALFGFLMIWLISFKSVLTSILRFEFKQFVLKINICKKDLFVQWWTRYKWEAVQLLLFPIKIDLKALWIASVYKRCNTFKAVLYSLKFANFNVTANTAPSKVGEIQILYVIWIWFQLKEHLLVLKRSHKCYGILCGNTKYLKCNSKFKQDWKKSN